MIVYEKWFNHRLAEDWPSMVDQVDWAYSICQSSDDYVAIKNTSTILDSNDVFELVERHLNPVTYFQMKYWLEDLGFSAHLEDGSNRQKTQWEFYPVSNDDAYYELDSRLVELGDALGEQFDHAVKSFMEGLTFDAKNIYWSYYPKNQMPVDLKFEVGGQKLALRVFETIPEDACCEFDIEIIKALIAGNTRCFDFKIEIYQLLESGNMSSMGAIYGYEVLDQCWKLSEVFLDALREYGEQAFGVEVVEAACEAAETFLIDAGISA